MKRLLYLIPVALFLMAPGQGGPTVGGWGFGGNPNQKNKMAWFEFAPASGAGMGAACACTTPTGAKGEALTFTRGSSAACTKTATGGLATTGIANGDLVTCSTNQPRVEYASAGVLGLLVESARTNVLLRSDALTNAAWADVGTPNATDGATDPFGGTTGDTLTDNAAGAFEGRSQAVTVSAATAYIMSCYLKGTTSAKARLSLDGTTCDTSTLSSTTWSLVTCADASSSGVSISAQVLVGNAVGDTGDVVVGGCQVEAGTYATSYIPTTGAAANRLADVASFATTNQVASGSAALSITPQTTIGNTGAGTAYWLNTSNTGRHPYSATSVFAAYDGTNVATISAALTIPQYTVGSPVRMGASWGSSSLGVFIGTESASGPFDGTMGSAGSTLYIGGDNLAQSTHPGIYSKLCVDPSPTRCR